MSIVVPLIFLYVWYQVAKWGTSENETSLVLAAFPPLKSFLGKHCQLFQGSFLLDRSDLLLLVVEVKAFQWNVRPRWGRNFWKSVRCCVQLVFSMFVFSPIDGLSWVFHGYHADGCSYSLVFWEFCTSLVARSVVQGHWSPARTSGLPREVADCWVPGGDFQLPNGFPYLRCSLNLEIFIFFFF